jgi:uncharacterized protein
VPGLHIGGWYDIFLRGTIRNFQGLRRHARTEANRKLQRLVIGPWFHMPWMPQGGAPAETAGVAVIDDLQLQWFDRTLKGQKQSGDDSPVTIWINGEDTWRHFEDWPPPQQETVNWFLHSDGRANSRFGDGALSTDSPGSEVPDIFTYDPMNPVVSLGGHSCCFPFAAPMGPSNQAAVEQSNGVLVYTSSPFEREALIVGDVELLLYAITDAVDTDWSARLCLVDQNGESTNLLEGIVRAQFRDSLERPTRLEPNRLYKYHLDLGAIGLMVKSGECLRLDIASSDFPQWARNMNTGVLEFDEGLSSACVATQVVLHSVDYPSHLKLPIVKDL